jgi:hypothetical protein
MPKGQNSKRRSSKLSTQSGDVIEKPGKSAKLTSDTDDDVFPESSNRR